MPELFTRCLNWYTCGLKFTILSCTKQEAGENCFTRCFKLYAPSPSSVTATFTDTSVRNPELELLTERVEKLEKGKERISNHEELISIAEKKLADIQDLQERVKKLEKGKERIWERLNDDQRWQSPFVERIDKKLFTLNILSQKVEKLESCNHTLIALTVDGRLDALSAKLKALENFLAERLHYTYGRFCAISEHLSKLEAKRSHSRVKGKRMKKQ